MDLVWIAPTLLVPATAIAWKHGIKGDARSLIQGFLVVFAAMVSAGAYLALKLRFNHEPDFIDKFWITIPLFASLIVTGRCIFGRLVQLIVHTRWKSRSKNEVSGG